MASPWIVVPVKRLGRAKHRLSPLLSEQERGALMMAMLEDVLDAICGMAELAGILVATRSRRARALARERGLPTFPESPGADHAGTVTEASVYIAQRHGAARMLALSADIPGVTRDDVRQVLARREPVVLVPDRHGTGTSAVLSDLPLRLVLQFGEDSLRKHRASSRPAAALCPNTHISGDIDTIDDLIEVSGSLPDGATRRLLEQSGIAERLSLPLGSRPQCIAASPGRASRA
jgi:2-phospho-L-lactate guanylyltransferase